MNNFRKQQGAALIVSLIILAVVTMIGITGMQNSSLELKMVASAKDRSVAFEAAESTLLFAEEQLKDNPPSLDMLYSGCDNSTCFNSACNGGLCFAGSFPSGSEKAHCLIAEPNATDSPEFWADKNLDIWNRGKYRTKEITDLKTPVKYIVEFMCFTRADSNLNLGMNTETENPRNSENENYTPIFRITAFAEGNAKRASVVLQSTYKVAQEG